jgi:molecular chaperone GrpE
MFRQAFSTSSRSLRSVAAPRLPSTQTTLLAPRLRFAAASRNARPAAGVRWYSDAKEAETEGAKAEEAKKEGNGEADPVAELKKQLEAKETEAREWKVSNRSSYSTLPFA